MGTVYFREGYRYLVIASCYFKEMDELSEVILTFWWDISYNIFCKMEGVIFLLISRYLLNESILIDIHL